MPKKKRKRKEKHLEIPSRLKINGKNWKIYNEPKIPKWAKKEKLDLESENAWAMTLPAKQEIILSKDLKNRPRMRDMAFIHEILHAVLPTKEHLRTKLIRPIVEERAITVMAPELVRVFKQLKWK